VYAGLFLWAVAPAAAQPAEPAATASADARETSEADPAAAPGRIDAIDERLRRLEEALVARDDELRAARQALDAQRRQLEDAGLAAAPDERDADGRLDRFLDSVSLRGWVAASYWWNVNDPRSGVGANRGNPALGRRPGGLGFPYHPDHNSLQFDQAWLALRKPAREDGRGGFEVEVVFGKTADVLRGAAPTRADLSAIYQAYVEYLAPVGPGVLLRVGRFETHLGVETVRTPDNPNVTRGLVKSQLQPVTHTGAKLETRLGSLRAMVGVANDAIADPDTDLDADKAILWGLGLPLGDTLEIRVGGVYGGDGLLPGSATTLPPGTGFGRSTDKLGIVDVVVQWRPSPVFEAYVVGDYVWSDGEEAVPAGSAGPPLRIPGDPWAYGVAVGSSYRITERSAFGFRAELLHGEDNFLDPFLVTGAGNHTLWSLTGTFAHRVAEPLLVRIEGRYEAGESAGSNRQLFVGPRVGGFESDQVVAGVEAVYEF
jgi:hypothetical protein